jgi:hypothetical protein
MGQGEYSWVAASNDRAATRRAGGVVWRIVTRPRVGEVTIDPSKDHGHQVCPRARGGDLIMLSTNLCLNGMSPRAWGVPRRFFPSMGPI